MKKSYRGEQEVTLLWRVVEGSFSVSEFEEEAVGVFVD
jgi:hypothetical protein